MVVYSNKWSITENKIYEFTITQFINLTRKQTFLILPSAVSISGDSVFTADVLQWSDRIYFLVSLVVFLVKCIQLLKVEVLFVFFWASLTWASFCSAIIVALWHARCFFFWGLQIIMSSSSVNNATTDSRRDSDLNSSHAALMLQMNSYMGK